MKINLAKSAGFCFGVKRAIDIAFKTACSCEKVFMLGDIVHNEDVVGKMRQVGIKKIKKLSRGRNKTLLISAHGISPRIARKASRLGYKVVDATCPMVKEIQNIAQKKEKEGYQIVIIGDEKHDEVHGIVGHLKRKAIIIDPAAQTLLGVIDRIKKGCIVVQSTQNMDKTLKIARILKERIRELEFFNTICKPTRIRQEEIKKMPLENEVMIIIGSKDSANTKRLYEISKSLNKRTYWIGSRKDIQRSWFKGVKKVGITAGASTPDSTTKDVIKYIKQIKQ